MQQSSPQSSLNRDREREPRDRDREIMERQREMHREEEIMQREREMRERDREHAERYHREQQHHPIQSHTGSIPIHQPVASKAQNSIHGPNGLLSNLGASTGPNPPQGSLQGSNVPGSIFGGQMQHPDGPPRQYMPVQSQSLMGFTGNAQSQIPGSVAALAQGQQPILNVSFFSVSSLVTSRFPASVNIFSVRTCVCDGMLFTCFLLYHSLLACKRTRVTAQMQPPGTIL